MPNKVDEVMRKLARMARGETEVGPTTDRLVGPMEERDQIHADLSAPTAFDKSARDGEDAQHYADEGTQQLREALWPLRNRFGRDHYYGTVKPAVDDYRDYFGGRSNMEESVYKSEADQRRDLETQAKLQAIKDLMNRNK